MFVLTHLFIYLALFGAVIVIQFGHKSFLGLQFHSYYMAKLTILQEFNTDNEAEKQNSIRLEKR